MADEPLTHRSIVRLVGESLGRMRGTFTALLVLLLLYSFVPLLFGQRGEAVREALAALVIMAGLISVFDQKSYHVLVLAAGIPAFVMIWLNLLFPSAWLIIWVHRIIGPIFLGVVSGLTLRHIFLAKRVTPDMVAGAVSVYLLIGAMFAQIYSLIESVHPGSFSFPSSDQAAAGLPHSEAFHYFSFVALTTVGFGDITPISPAARLFAAFEAITGQMYVAVLIAALVGKAVAQAARKE
jgi:hypothetical protein